MSLINRAAIKRLILDHAKEKRQGWNCTRVAGEALDNYEAIAGSLLREWTRDPQEKQGRWDGRAKLLVWSTARTQISNMLARRFPWLTVSRIDDWAIDYLEYRLARRIKSDVEGHRTKGSTFDP